MMQNQTLSPESQNSNLFSNKQISARYQVPQLNFRYAQHSPHSQLNNSALYNQNNIGSNEDRDRPSNNLNPMQNQTPSQKSNISIISPKDDHSQRQQNFIDKNQNDFYNIDKPLKTEDSLQNEDDQKNLESIYQRIQNLRKNISTKHPISYQANTTQQQQIPKTLNNVLQQNYTLEDSSQSNQIYRGQQLKDSTNLGNQTEHTILQGMMFNDVKQQYLQIPSQRMIQYVDEGVLESQRSNQYGNTLSSLESYDVNNQQNVPNLRQPNHSNQQMLINSDFFSPNINHQQNDNNQQPKDNLSPKLLSTHGDLQLQFSEIDLHQFQYNQNNSNQIRSNRSNSQIKQHQQNNNLYTFNQSSVNTLHDNYQQQQQQFVSIQDLIRESEQRVKKETEMKFQQKIKELEKKSHYLDRSLELIEDMKFKFQQVENQNSDYNDLLMKYNSLLNQFNSKSQSDITSQNYRKSPTKRLNTIQLHHNNSF